METLHTFEATDLIIHPNQRCVDKKKTYYLITEYIWYINNPPPKHGQRVARVTQCKVQERRDGTRVSVV